MSSAIAAMSQLHPPPSRMCPCNHKHKENVKKYSCPAQKVVDAEIAAATSTVADAAIAAATSAVADATELTCVSGNGSSYEQACTTSSDEENHPGEE